MPVQFTTELPDEDQPVLGNGVEDEVAVDRETAVSDYGDVRIQIRETGASSWDSNATGFGEFIGAYDTLTMEFVGREDGEEYEVRARTETEHVTGAWTSPIAITTEFPGVTSLSVSSTGQTSVGLEGQDNADNEDGFRIQHQRKYDHGWGPWETAVDVNASSGTGSVSFTDDTLSPGNTYRFRVEAYTEHTSATSNETAETTTTSSGRPRTRTSASGWMVEVDHPSGRTLRPRLLDDPEARPRVNNLPQIRIPVPHDEKWQAEAFEEANMRVWEDGQKQPIGTLVDVEQQPDRTILVGEGGRELKQPVEAEYDIEDIHVAVGNLIEGNTSYAADVDAPEQTFRQDVLQKSIDTETDWLNDLNTAIASDEPWQVTSDGRLQRKQTSWTMEGEAVGSDTDSFDGYSMGEALRLPDLVTYGPWNFTTTHDVPAGDWQVALRVRMDGDTDDANPAYRVLLDGTAIASVSKNILLGGPIWLFEGADFSVGAGDHTIELEVTELGAETMNLDVVNFHDARYYETGNFPDQNTQINGPLAGPRDYVAGSRETTDATTGQQIVGGRLDAAIDDTSGPQAVAISNDQGQTWLTAENSEVVDGEFADPSGRIRARFTLGGYGSRLDETPSEGYQPQSADVYDLYADIDETPAFINQSFDGHLDRILRDGADQGDFIWEYTLVDGTPTVVWTQPGQRVSDDELDLVDYRLNKRSGTVYEKVTVVGSPQTVRSEQFTADVGTAVELPHAYLVDGSETVIDPGSPGQTFERNVDYNISYLDGTITALSAGSMSDGTTYEVDYQYETRGSYALDSAADPREAPQQTIPGLTSPQATEQAAITIVNEVSEPLWDVQLTVPPRKVGFNVSEALALPQLPTDGAVEVRSVSNSPSEITIEAGSRESVGEVVQQIQERVGQVSRRS